MCIIFFSISICLPVDVLTPQAPRGTPQLTPRDTMTHPKSNLHYDDSVYENTDGQLNLYRLPDVE